MRKLLIALGAAFGLVAGLAMSQAQAGQILLQGTDAWELHGDTAYGLQVRHFDGGNIALINDFGVSGATVYAGVPVTGFSSVPTLATLSGFSGVEFASPSRCCGDPTGDPSLHIQANYGTINAYLARGGNISIENFASAAGWAPVLGFDATGHIAGACDSTGAVTPAGVAAGFTSHVDFCFTHQTYDTAFFAAHGFTDLIDNGFVGGRAVVLARVVPEPSSLALLCTAFIALGVFTWRRAARAEAELA